MIDTGSGGTYMRSSVARKLKLPIIPHEKTVPLAASGQNKIKGAVIADMGVNGSFHKGAIVEVIDNLFIEMIIGRDIMGKHKRVVLNFDGPREDLVIGATNNNSKLTMLPPMDVPAPPLFTYLTSNIKPVATKSRKHTPVDMKFIKETVTELHSNGIIRPSVSPWRAQPFVTCDTETHKKRMVIDYSNTINLFTELDAYPIPDILKMVQDISKYKYFATFDLKSAYHQVPIRESDCKYTAY